MSITHSWRFLKGYLREPRVVGALTPSSRSLALAISEPYRRFPGPARVLEVGAGTGAITRHLGAFIKPQDQLDICEIRPEFTEIIERDILSLPTFIPAVESGRVRVLCQPAQAISAEQQYDFVISGLPFTGFELDDVQTIFDVIARCLKPNGVFSYYEYVGLRRTTRALTFGPSRARFRSVSAFLARNIREHQFAHRTVFQNVPPAHARHLRFNGCSEPSSEYLGASRHNGNGQASDPSIQSENRT